MQISAVEFRKRAALSSRDANLQKTMELVRPNFIGKRRAAVLETRDFESLRDLGRDIRDESVARMPELLEQFEERAMAAGTAVLWAENAQAAREIFADIVARHKIKTAVKSKSMASEEIGLNAALSAAGAEPVETDLGEYIIQLADEPPSHIIAPVMHKRREEVAEILARATGVDRNADIPALTAAARAALRKKFLSADMGISGANFLIAETGSSLIVTNEGNGRMTTTLPRVHVTLAGVDKIIPRWRDLPPLLALLTRSATGQRLSNYVSVTTGVRRAGDSEGPEHSYVILLDNGRSRLRGGELQEMLRCIRCGACMNHCPVYYAAGGGQSFGSPYMGPMGQVLTPALAGLKNAPDFPHAATMCGACAVACPVRIPLPDLMRRLREQQAENEKTGSGAFSQKALTALWSFCARRPVVYGLASAVAARALKMLGGKRRMISGIPMMKGGWFAGRDLPAPPGRTFREMRRELGLD